MTFHSQHRPLETYFLALEEAGLLVEALREPGVPDQSIGSARSAVGSGCRYSCTYVPADHR
jgi:hypothetical protein